MNTVLGERTVKNEVVMSNIEKIEFRVLVVITIIANIFFWSWFLNPQYFQNLFLFALRLIPAFYVDTVMPVMYLFLLSKMRKPVHIPVQANVNVALITLTVVGSESLEIVRRQMHAMVEVTYPHDNWILVDGKHSLEIKKLAISMGVHYFSRHDQDEWGTEKVKYWNKAGPPFKAKTKAGNVNAWLDAFGDQYEVFTQYDIDHNPRPDYLHKVLGYFGDPKIQYVQAPSVYGHNLHQWSARGAAEMDLGLHGPLQMGMYGWTGVPFIIGSHCTYRMSSIKAIGGFQPTRAEDHLDTLYLALNGGKGVFVPEEIATGDGPENFEMDLAQQFAWAYSMFQIFLKYTWKVVTKLEWRQKIQFVFAQSWYPLWSISMLILFILPILALFGNMPVMNVGLGEFVIHSAPANLIMLFTYWWSRKWFHPKGIFLSWRGIILDIARWPVIISALIQAIFNVKKPYMITQKGMTNGEERPFYLSTHIPFLALTLLSLVTCVAYVFTVERSGAEGYLIFAIINAVTSLLVYVVVLTKEISEMTQQGVSLLRSSKLRSIPLLIMGVLMILTFFTITLSSRQIGEALAYSTQKYNMEVIPTNLVDLPKDRPFVGIFDPQSTFNNYQLDVEQDYVGWDNSSELTSKIDKIRLQNRVPFITIEPWVTSSGASINILTDTVSGTNDFLIKMLTKAIKLQGEQLVLLRWGHEMDQVGLYPWSVKDCNLYINAFRHVVNSFREEKVNNVRWIWSPIGSPTSVCYYPGSQYVDYVGLTMLKYLSWEDRNGGSERSFKDMFGEKYATVATLRKPIIIAELGVAANNNFQTAWLKDAFEQLKLFPLIRGVVYFNSLNTPKAWGGETPDWRIKTSQLPLIR